MPAEYELTVASKVTLSSHMLRLELTGDDLARFPEDQESGYVKMVFPVPDGSAVLRSYTVRAFDAAAQRLVLDFVDHGDSGPASTWARQAEPGATITVRGPGEKKVVDASADWVLIAGDLAALPAISVNLEQLPEDARGYCLIEVPGEGDVLPLVAPIGVDVRWIVSSDPSAPNQALLDGLFALDWLPGTPYPWFAGEFDAMRRVRRYFRDERGIDRKRMYVSCYWKQGETDEGMKRAKRLDAEQDAAN